MLDITTAVMTLGMAGYLLAALIRPDWF
ncbi:MAG: K(+)-transporting ATPase subunit F [Holosporales bacterium]|nr:K(+)-transporting ATPase subunit F [Thalassospira sp.]